MSIRRGNVHLQAVAVVLVEALETLDEKEGRRQPDRTTPVRVASEHAAQRVTGPVVDAELLAVYLGRPRILLVPQGQAARRRVVSAHVPAISARGPRRHSRSDTVVTEELVLVEHALKDAAQAVLASEGEQTPVSLTAD